MGDGRRFRPVHGTPEGDVWDVQAMVANVPAVFFRGYADGSIDPYDRKIEAMSGYLKEDFDSRRVKWTDLIWPDDRDAAKRAFVDALKTTRTYTREYRISQRSGQPAWVHERSQIACDAGGRVQVISGLFFDITDRKRLEADLRDAEHTFRIVVDNIPAVMFKGFLDGTIELLDNKVEGMIGYPVRSFGAQGLRWTDLIEDEDRAGVRLAFIQALKTSGSYVREYRVRSVRGTPVWIHERGHIVRDDDGKALYVSGFFFDVTERKRLESEVAERTAQLQQANDRLRLWAGELENRNSEINLLGQMGDLLQSCNTTGEAYAGIERFLTRLFPDDSGALFVFGDSQRSVEAVAVWGRRPPEERVFAVDECWGLRRGRPHSRVEVESGFRCRHVAAGDVPYLCVPMTAHGTALGVLHVLLGSDLDPQRWDTKSHLGVRVAEHLALAIAKLRLQETLHSLSVRDPLTGLFNRRYMEETIARELRRAERQGRELGVIMVDIDHFKRFNDTLGHDAGDAVLRELGALLQRAVRASDVACRYGGEEFTVILQEVPAELTARRAEEIRQAAKQLRVHSGGRELDTITLSLGVAVFPKDGATPELLLQNADIALYRAKRDGRDRVCVAGQP